ncbi:hypothetical protein PVAP13_2KG203456 [Panicum virgatum]|uniref:Uncharacterized protein n=1 Tax=Panicum virgatum TaxID=38727 RepID=A0A8T0WBD6_PANVG|nr:hypothetical protein PVAP13_2KG203456 [Panicum virgatum]
MAASRASRAARELPASAASSTSPVGLHGGGAARLPSSLILPHGRQARLQRGAAPLHPPPSRVPPPLPLSSGLARRRDGRSSTTAPQQRSGRSGGHGVAAGRTTAHGGAVAGRSGAAVRVRETTGCVPGGGGSVQHRGRRCGAEVASPRGGGGHPARARAGRGHGTPARRAGRRRRGGLLAPRADVGV